MYVPLTTELLPIPAHSSFTGLLGLPQNEKHREPFLLRFISSFRITCVPFVPFSMLKIFQLIVSQWISFPSIYPPFFSSDFSADIISPLENLCEKRGKEILEKIEVEKQKEFYETFRYVLIII